MFAMFIGNELVELPIRFRAGQSLSGDEATILNSEYIQRVASQIRWRFKRGEIAKEDLQKHAEQICNNFIFIPKEEEEDDIITTEAIYLAKELIIKELANEGIKALPNIEGHARILAQNSIELRQKAKVRLIAKHKIANAAIAGGK